MNEPQFPNESRFLTVHIGGLWLSSVYAPYGPKCLTKRGAIKRRIAWLKRLRDNIRVADHDRWMLCGDFNVKMDGPPWKGYYSQSEKDVLEELGFVDAYRRAHPAASNRPGWTRGYSEKDPMRGDSRLHLMLTSKGLAQSLRSAYVDVESRPWPRRDSPPLVVELDDF